jgi:hypothetical protein
MSTRCYIASVATTTNQESAFMKTVPAQAKADDARTERVITEARLTYEPAEQTIKLPTAAQVIGVRHGLDGIRLFVTCNPHLPAIDRVFCLRKSDEALPEPQAFYRYIGTLDEMPAVHVFEKRA